MTKTYRLTLFRRALNLIVRAMLQVGLRPGSIYLLTTRGRRTGQPHSTPVTLVEKGDRRWLVSPYGAVSWVCNARAAGQVTLSRGGRSQTVGVEELGPSDSAPVLKSYLKQVPIVQPFFAASASSDLDAFVAEAPRHPVFRITEPVTS